MGHCIDCKWRKETLPGLYQCSNKYSSRYRDDCTEYSTCQGFYNVIQKKTKHKNESKEIALRIKQAMGKNYDTKSLAEHCGIGYQAMRNILAAEVAPRISTIIQIARVLDASIDWLCGLKEE